MSPLPASWFLCAVLCDLQDYFFFICCNIHICTYLCVSWLSAWVITPFARLCKLCNLESKGEVGKGTAPGARVTPLYCCGVDLSDSHLFRFHCQKTQRQDERERERIPFYYEETWKGVPVPQMSHLSLTRKSTWSTSLPGSPQCWHIQWYRFAGSPRRRGSAACPHTRSCFRCHPLNTWRHHGLRSMTSVFRWYPQNTGWGCHSKCCMIQREMT